MNDTSKSERPRRSYKHFPIGTHTSKINDTEYTEKVKTRLRNNFRAILDFSYDWQYWLIEHPECLPVKKTTQKPILTDIKLDDLLRLIVQHIRGKPHFTPDEKIKLSSMIVHIYEKDGRTVSPDIHQSIENFFIGKVS